MPLESGAAEAGPTEPDLMPHSTTEQDLAARGPCGLPGTAHRIDPDRWRPLIMSFQQFYGLGPRLHASRLGEIDEEWYRPGRGTSPAR